MISLSFIAATVPKKLSGIARASFKESVSYNRNFAAIQKNHLCWRKMSTASGTDELKVQHDPKRKKFYIKLGEAEAVLEYVHEDRNGQVLDLWHTEVPPALQGKGIAKILAKEAFDYVVKNNLKMRLSCSYLQKYFNDNPSEKYKNAVVK